MFQRIHRGDAPARFHLSAHSPQVGLNQIRYAGQSLRTGLCQRGTRVRALYKLPINRATNAGTCCASTCARKSASRIMRPKDAQGAFPLDRGSMTSSNDNLTFAHVSTGKPAAPGVVNGAILKCVTNMEMIPWNYAGDGDRPPAFAQPSVAHHVSQKAPRARTSGREHPHVERRIGTLGLCVRSRIRARASDGLG
jgi:hypothetical protein